MSPSPITVNTWCSYCLFEGPLIAPSFFENLRVAVLYVYKTQLALVLFSFLDGISLPVNTMAGIET